MIIKIYIVGPLLRGLQGLAGGLLGGGASNATDGIGGYGPTVPSAKGNVFYGGNVIPFAKGGIVTAPTIFPMAHGAGLMGEAGPEAVVPLQRGPDGKLGISSSGGSPQFNVIVNNYGNSEVKQEQKQNNTGGIDFMVIIDGATAKNAANPGSATSQVLNNRNQLGRR